MEIQDYNKYKDFTEDDFIADPFFQDSVLNSNGDNSLYWKTFFEIYPDKKEAGEIARAFLSKLRFREELPEDSLIKSALAKHLQDIERFESSRTIDIRTTFPLKKLLQIAAVLGGVILIVATLFISNKKDEKVLVKTEYGKLKSIVLPDSSLVVVNANSTIKYSDKWGEGNSREVWLQGEAFFNVRHINKDTTQIKKVEQFVVHTEDLIVEVLGTSFDIRQRRGKTEVVLQTGKIKVLFKDKRKKDLLMKPGEMMVYNQQENKLITTTISAENFSAWKEKKLILNDPTATEIAEYLEDNFGKDIIIEGRDLAKRKIEGPILLTNLDDALFVISTVLNTQIIKKDSIITIRPR